MKIGIYSPLSPEYRLGGAESCVAILAESLAKRHQVEFVHHCTILKKDQLADLSGTDLNRVHLRYVAPQLVPWLAPQDGLSGSNLNPLRRYQQSRAWHATLSEGYDLFINFAMFLPPFCHAPKGVLIVLFPRFDPPDNWPWKTDPSVDRSRLRVGLRRLYYNWEWKKRMNSYQIRIAISHFTKIWTRRRWGIDCHVVYPPAGHDFGTVDKTNKIISVGRFESDNGCMKKQLETVASFQEMEEVRQRGWEYYCVGGLSASPRDYAYFDTVRRLGARCGAYVLANLERALLKRVYEQAKIFWHAAGYGANDSAYPDRSEHFGMATVEAMAAGCVPIVINKGAQPEIIQHGVNGFLWNTLDEMKDYTRRLVCDDRLRTQMSESARARAQDFAREKFVQRIMTLLGPTLS